MGKLVSIIIPIYNVEKYLDKCITSVVNQTYKNLEIILVDDGSPDSCPQICDKWQKEDKRIKVIHKKNGGLSDARNAGIDVAKGDYLSFIDSDDSIHSQFVEVLLNMALQNNADLSICKFERVFENSIIKETRIEKVQDVLVYKGKESIFQKFLSDSKVSWITACTKLYKKNIFDNLRFDVGKLHEDAFIIHKILNNAKIICETQLSLYYYLYRVGGITKSNYNEKACEHSLEAFKIRNCFFKKYENFKELSVINYLSNLISIYCYAKFGKASKYLLKKIRDKFLIEYKEIKKTNLKLFVFKNFPALYYVAFKIINKEIKNK